jgi:hypothetical protein
MSRCIPMTDRKNGSHMPQLNRKFKPGLVDRLDGRESLTKVLKQARDILLQRLGGELTKEKKELGELFVVSKAVLQNQAVDRRVSRPCRGTRSAPRLGWRYRPSADHRCDADLPGQPAFADELPRLPSPGAADHFQPHRIDHQSDQPAREGIGENLDHRGWRGTAATACRPTQRLPASVFLDPTFPQRHRHPHRHKGRLNTITKRVVRQYEQIDHSRHSLTHGIAKMTARADNCWRRTRTKRLYFH